MSVLVEKVKAKQRRKIVEGRIIWLCCLRGCDKEAKTLYEMNNGKYMYLCEEHDLREKTKPTKELEKALAKRKQAGTEE